MKISVRGIAEMFPYALQIQNQPYSMNIEELYQLFLKQKNITTDSRNCTTGALFFALKGDNFDGNRYATAALESGASYCVVDDEQYKGAANMIWVPNVLKSLQELARHHRRTFNIPVIAITGSNGKTTTKELVAAVLSQKFNTLFTQGNLNNHIGVPLTLLQLRSKHEIAVIEMGANHLGEIAELCAIAEPNYGIVTNVGKAHMEGFGTLEGILETKTAIYRFVKTHGSKIFVDADNEMLMNAATDNTKVLYGTNESNYVSGKIVKSNPFLQFEWQCSGIEQSVKTQLVGNYNLTNALAAIAVGMYFKVPETVISRAIEQYIPTNNRSMFQQTKCNKLIVDAYNANPTSMVAALRNFEAYRTVPKVVILGDMLEMGASSAEEHQQIVELLESLHFDRVVLCGKHFELSEHHFEHYTTTDELFDALSKNPINDATVLIKGSRAMRLERVIDLL